MSLPADVLEEISIEVRGGFDDRERIIEMFLEEKYEPGELDENEVAAAVDAAIQEHEKQKLSWPTVTDCDKLARVFARLNANGIIAIHNAGYTQSDGYDDVLQIHDEHPDKKAVLGYCYYHGQDLERVVQGQGLYLSFGPIDPQNEETKGPKVGAVIESELKAAGFSVEWDGTFSKRISIPEFDWKNR
jgi:hypothetical protein